MITAIVFVSKWTQKWKIDPSHYYMYICFVLFKSNTAEEYYVVTLVRSTIFGAAKFCGSNSVVSFLSLSWVQNIFLSVFSGFQKSFSWTSRRSKIFFCRYYPGLKSILVVLSWDPIFSMWVFPRLEMFSIAWSLEFQFFSWELFVIKLFGFNT